MGSNMDHDPRIENAPKSYVLSGKIMLIAIVILFVVVIFLVVLHIYARWYLRLVRRQYATRRRTRRQRATHIVFYVDPNNPNSVTSTAPIRGLGAAVLNSLPVFVYSSGAHPDPLECAVCLSEFEENEKGRILPRCQHSFHIECIDMWFQSHSTCPLCRSPVEPDIPVQVTQNNQSDLVLSVDDPTQTEPGSSSGFCATCQQEGGQNGSTSLADRRKGLVGVRIEVPRRNESEDESTRSRESSPASHGFKSPGSRLLSLKRILSMNRKGSAISPSSGIGTSCGSVGTELDVELGSDESTQRQTRAHTPRSE